MLLLILYVSLENFLMMKKNILLTTILLNISSLAIGQYTDVVNSNNPGKSIGAYSVGRKVIQAESEFFYEKSEHRGLYTRQHNFGVNYEVRYGVWREQFEAIFDGTLLYNDTETYRFLSTNERKLGFYRNTLGAKYLLYNPEFQQQSSLYSWKVNNEFRWSNLIPAVSVYLGANLFSKNRFLYEALNEDPAVVTPKAMVSLQSHPIARVVLVANLIGDNFASKNAQWSYIVTLTHNLYNERWSIFLENEGITSSYYKDVILRGGASFLVNDNLQVNAWIGSTWKITPTRYMGAVGVSYRFYDKHREIEFKEKLKAREEENKADAELFGF